ncbi:MAG TPA: ribonuclease P protein component [Xanthobacteraceae bacterium]|nr:ribonuclease P protein component [Xanthobacteraceae bacterium]
MRDRDALAAVVERLKRRNDFRAAAKGVRASGRAFVLQALRRAETGGPRVGFTVSRQVGNAVERNRVRRRLREMVHISGAAGAGRLCPGHDYVLIGRRAALAVPFSEMMQELDAALTRIHAQDVIRAPDANNPAHRGTGDGSRDPLHQPKPVSRRRKPRPGHGG